MEEIREIQFVDIDTGAPIATVTGENARALFEQSELLQNVANFKNQANPTFLVVPIGGFINERRTLFANILNGIPVGSRHPYSATVDYYPLGPEEEKDIAAAVAKQIDKMNVYNELQLWTTQTVYRLTQLEREKAIFETLQYLLIPDSLINDMLVFENEQNTHQREYSVEDRIEEAIQRHLYYLYLTGQKYKMTNKEYEEMEKHFNGIEEQYKKNEKNLRSRMNENAKKRATRRRHGRYNNSNNNAENDYYDEKRRNLEEGYHQETDPSFYEPIEEAHTGNMTTRDYEKFLRSEYFKKAPLEQNALHLNSLFNENRRALRNRVNRPKVVYVSNKNNNTTRKRNAKKNKNNKTARNA